MTKHQRSQGSKYIDEQRKAYSLYVLQSRAIPHAADGLKAAARRILWTARNGKTIKSATLAGATMPIHPHQSPEGAVNTLASVYNNNIPLLTGIGAFGTLLNPTAYGAARYTSVRLSNFTQDVVFRDLAIVPLQENYDGTLEEPVHYLPLVPIALLNPQEGIAVGFATNILPRSLTSIIKAQVDYLSGKMVKDDLPELDPIDQRALRGDGGRYFFEGSFERVNATTIKITNLPYGITHSKFIDKLNVLEDQGQVQGYVDDSRDEYDITVKFKRGTLSKVDDPELLRLLNLTSGINENMTVIDFDGQSVLKTTYADFIKAFCDWRLKWYMNRYLKLADDIEIDIQKYKDILRAIARNVGGVSKKIASRAELKEFLTAIGIVYIDYIADLPVYRFTQEEKEKVEQKKKEAESKLRDYKAMLRSENKRREQFIVELKGIQTKFRKGAYK